MRIHTATILLFLFALMSFGAVHTHATGTSADKTRVRGNVYDFAAGNWVEGTNVSVTCEGITLVGTTTATGLYVVDFKKNECPKFALVSATVTHAGETLSQTVQVSNRFTATMDFSFGAVGVPEFGMIPGVVAALGSGVAYLGLKRKIH